MVAAFSQPYVSLQLRAPLQIQGAPFVPIGAGPQAASSIAVRSAELTGSFTAAELFGASAHRTLQLTLINDGGEAKTLTALVKVGGNPQPQVTLSGLAQGQVRTYSIRVDFPRVDR